MISARRTACLFVFFSFLSALLHAQVTIVPRARPRPATESGESRAHLRVDTSLALIPAHVTTLLGAPIMNLRKDDFRLYEDGVEQAITYFTQEDAPLSIGLLFDSSGS